MPLTVHQNTQCVSVFNVRVLSENKAYVKTDGVLLPLCLCLF